MLTQMGFVEGDVVEIILTTVSETEVPNAAPMGVWVKPGPSLNIRPYEDTQTAHNIENNGEAVINLTQNPQLFLVFAFKEEFPRPKEVIFESSKTVRAPRISPVSGFIEVTVKPRYGREFAAPFKEYVCRIQHVDLNSAYPLVYSRARNAAIECVIYATKIRALHRTDPGTTQRLARQIDEHLGFVERIAPKSPSFEVIHRIKSLLPKWIK